MIIANTKRIKTTRNDSPSTVSRIPLFCYFITGYYTCYYYLWSTTGILWVDSLVDGFSPAW